MDTIFSLATARGKSGVAVIRISGREAFATARELVGSLPEPGRHGLRSVRDRDGTHIDQALVLVFEGPRSFTGEDTVELHLHGSIAVVRAVERVISETGRARPAEAGEFTRRALLNDRLDLSQVEGLGELIDAETEAQRKQAMRLLDGGLREVAESWRGSLLQAVALIEVTIDFADEEVPQDVVPEVEEILGKVIRSLAQEIDGSRVAERVRDGFEVAIVGPPNAGKSTLLNRIAKREVAITSEIAGTTRDVIEVRIDLHGLPVTLLDTAGLREAQDDIERIGVKRTKDRAHAADLRVVLLGADIDAVGVDVRDGDLVYRSKSDIREGGNISGLTGEGVDRMLQDVADRLAQKAGQVSIATTERHRAAMLAAKGALEEARRLLACTHDEPEMAAEQMRRAVVALDSLVGRIDVEAVLGEIFSRFCIGK